MQRRKQYMGILSKLFRKKHLSSAQLEPSKEASSTSLPKEMTSASLPKDTSHTSSSPTLTPAPTPEKTTQDPTQAPVQNQVQTPTQPTPRIFMGEFDLLEGYRLVYQRSGNKYGFSCRINACLYKGDELIRKMTDETGRFLDFPGVEHGEWEKDLKFPFEPVTDFPFYISKKFKDNELAELEWMVQPDGRYWEDEDGFGAGDDVKIILYASFDRTGKFVTPFHVKKD